MFKSNIPQHDESVENDIDISFDLEYLPAAAAYDYCRPKCPILKT